MKSFVFLFVMVLGMCLWGCTEKEVVIPEVVPDSDKAVLIEEFTGVECVNCPQGSAELENLLGLYGENLIAVSIHAGIFSDPYPESKYNFKTTEGTGIQEYVGNPLGWPSAVVNRHNASGSMLQIPLNRWAGAIEEALSRDPLVSIGGELEFDRAARTGRLELNMVGLGTTTEPIAVTVLIKESYIRDMQLTPSGLDPNYEHKHVLRKTVTPFAGETVTMGLGIGEVVSKGYNFQFDESWVIDNCRIIAFAHYNGSSKEVLQAREFEIPN